MKISENVHMIKSGYHGIYTAMYLICGSSLTLIDSGEFESWYEDILPYIRKIGRKPEELKRIIHTHGHDDHVHSDLQIKQATGAEIIISEIGSQFLEKPDSRAHWEEKIYDGYLNDAEREAIRLGTDYNGPPRCTEVILVDRCYREGEVLDAGPLKLIAIYTPGHTPDSYCMYEETQKVLFTGDSVNGEGTTFDDLPVFQNLDAVRSSMERLEQLDINLLLAAHPYLPFQEAVLNATRAKRLMRATVDINNRMSASILEILRKAEKPMATADISSKICAEFGPNKPQPRGHGTVRLHLVKLLKDGRIMAKRKRVEVLWELRNIA